MPTIETAVPSRVVTLNRPPHRAPAQELPRLPLRSAGHRPRPLAVRRKAAQG
ncbi:hypothetical protein HFP15_16295 [Amycolatopsis sp. K13G38]|uniref:Uncharacterized protein n=1 Tax=Amycolatopsis acididurans TaxID=2724524 RepID=A0ABX1J820_9PSEU|nr:hypothetical protein [Amycolatopsis acididurans]NKQ54442.1 hypothetical protein [Amycolatopsis acididurans]